MLEIEERENHLIWESGIEILERYYSRSNIFPKEELYGLCGHIQATSSLILNRKNHRYSKPVIKEYIKYFNHVLELLAEFENYLILSVKTKVVSLIAIQPILDLSDQLRSKIYVLIKKLAR